MKILEKSYNILMSNLNEARSLLIIQNFLSILSGASLDL